MSGGRRAYDRSGSALSRRLAAHDASRQGSRTMSDSAKNREERLAAALRENLRKRKAQARDKAEPPVTPPSKD
jgi:hypothetical protein